MPREPLFLHVGLPKTGTTDLQKVLWENRRGLGEAGVVYPGDARGEHYRAALDLLGNGRSPEAGSWDALVASARAARGKVVISHEMLAAAGPKKIQRIVDDFADRELHVVLTVRDFSRIVPATWQERAKNRVVESWPDFLDGVSQGPRGRHSFWRLQNTARVIRSWAEHVPGERIHVITVPPVQEDPQLLLRRFASVVGFSLDDVTLSERPANQSIGALEIAVLQEVNKVADHLSREEYLRLIKGRVVRDVLAQRPGQVRVVLPETARSWVEGEVRRTRKAVREVGCHLVGETSDLEPQGIGPRSDRETDHPEQVSPVDVQAATAQTLVALAEEIGELREQLHDAHAGAAGLARRAARRVRARLGAVSGRLPGRVRDDS
jgi:hypothetical protein